MVKLFFYFLPFLSLFLPSIWVNYVLRKNNEIVKFCPGINKGGIIKRKEIEKKIKDDEKNEIKILEEVN